MPAREAGTLAPRRASTERHSDTAISRTPMTRTATQGARCWPARTAKAVRTTALSASGSRYAPDLVAPCLRARTPSSESERPTAIHSTRAKRSALATMAQTRKGRTMTRPAVTALAGVTSAEGPNPPL